MPPWGAVAVAGAVIGVLLGMFGVGGSSVATPVLSLLGVPGLVAVASPLPGTIPAAIAAALPYIKEGEARPRAAGWSLLGAAPATIGGAYASRLVGGPKVLVVSGVALAVVGVRVMRPIHQSMRDAGTKRRKNRALLVAVAVCVGFLTGMLANGGGFLLVPLYLLVFGLRMRQAVGTSLLVVAVLAIPTLIAHLALGNVEWGVAGAFALGLIPGSVAGGRLAHSVEGPVVRRAFGWFLLLFGTAFTVYRVIALF